MDVVLGVVLLVTALVTVGYWLDFFLRGTVNVVEADWYIRFQRAFPAADGFMALVSAAAGTGLLLGRSWGVALALVSAGALLFLGLMDVLFNLQNGLYRHLPRSAPMRAELVINAWSLLLGVVLLVTYVPRVA